MCFKHKWIKVANDEIQWRGPLNTTMTLGFIKCEQFLNRMTDSNFPKIHCAP
jgi:hypothetical protein